MICPCGTGRDYEACCGKYHNGHALPDTPEQLMRSRYSAFVLLKEGYLAETMTDPLGSLGHEIKWLGLEVKWAKDKQVEFIAKYRVGDVNGQLHEISNFEQRGGKWIYTTGKIL